MRKIEELIKLIKSQLKYLRFYNYKLVSIPNNNTVNGLCRLIEKLFEIGNINAEEYKFLMGSLHEFMYNNLNVGGGTYANAELIFNFNYVMNKFNLGEFIVYFDYREPLDIRVEIKLCVERYKIFINNFLISLNYE